MPLPDRSAGPVFSRDTVRRCALATALAAGVVAIPAGARASADAGGAQRLGIAQADPRPGARNGAAAGPGSAAAAIVAAGRFDAVASVPAVPGLAGRTGRDGADEVVRAGARGGGGNAVASRDGGAERPPTPVESRSASGTLLVSFLALLAGIVMRRR
jgi:hypothetical protein